MIKEDWSKSLSDIGLLDYKNKSNNKQKENTWEALQITKNNTQLSSYKTRVKLCLWKKSISPKEKFKSNLSKNN